MKWNQKISSLKPGQILKSSACSADN